MREPRRADPRSGPARHEFPTIDDLGLAAARHGDRLLEAAKEVGAERWARYLEPIPDRLRDDGIMDLRTAAMRAAQPPCSTNGLTPMPR